MEAQDQDTKDVLERGPIESKIINYTEAYFAHSVQSRSGRTPGPRAAVLCPIILHGHTSNSSEQTPLTALIMA